MYGFNCMNSKQSTNPTNSKKHTVAIKNFRTLSHPWLTDDFFNFGVQSLTFISYVNRFNNNNKFMHKANIEQASIISNKVTYEQMFKDHIIHVISSLNIVI